MTRDLLEKKYKITARSIGEEPQPVANLSSMDLLHELNKILLAKGCMPYSVNEIKEILNKIEL